MRRIHQNTFVGGLDTDTSVNKYDNTKMVKSQNFRLLGGDKAHSAQAVSSIEYNQEVVRISERGGITIIGLGEIDSRLIIFAHNNTSSTTHIFEIPLDDIDPQGPLVLTAPTSRYIKLSRNFGYTSNTILKVIATRETTQIKKVYFTDRESGIFHVNLEDENIQNYDINKFRLIPHTIFSPITNVELISGQLKAGRVQYAYQYYNLNGSETLFSPVSNFINTTTSSQSSQVRLYQGSDIGETTSSGVRFTIPNPSREFDRVRLVRILYEEFQAEPAIQVFQETIVPDSGGLIITDRGTQVLEEMASEEFAELLLDIIPSTWETKNNYLFVGNTLEESFDMDYNARAVRYNSNEEAYTEIHDIKNPYNLLENDSDQNFRYKYHSELKTTDNQPVLGGKGENVEYWFRTKKLLIDQGEDIGEPYIKTLSAQDGSYANWELASKYVGYQRDEIYRFGLVGYDKKGRSSFVKWIDDIRMPDFSDDIEEVEVPGFSAVHEQFAYSYMRFRMTHHPENSMDITLEFSKNNQTESRRVVFNSTDSSIPQSDLENFKAVFNNNKPFGTIKLTQISYEEGSAGYMDTLKVRFEDQAVNGYVDLSAYYWNDISVGSTEFKVIDSGDYQEEVESGASNVIQNNYNLLTIEEDAGITSVYANVLYPVFKVTNLPEDIVSYQIVRVERDRENRTVIDMGMLGGLPASSENENELYFHNRLGSILDRDVFEYTSVEHLVNNLEGVQGDRLDFISTCELEDVKQFWGFQDDTNSNYIENARYYQQTFFPSDFSDNRRREIEASRDHWYIQDINHSYQFENYTILNTVFLISPASSQGLGAKGSTKLLKTSIPATTSMGVLARRRTKTYPYGGATRSSLRNSIYISTNAVNSRNSKITEVFDGDVYIGYFNYLRGLFPGVNETEAYMVRALNFITETTVNPELLVSKDLNGFTLKEVIDLDRDRVVLAMQEEAGAHEYFDEEIFEQDFNLYTYNSVYSQPKSLQRFFPKPKDFQDIVQWPNRIYYSDKKVLGESADSWLKFRPGNMMDVDTKYGAIKALISFRDNLFCFQEKGISILGVEQRELTQTDSPGPLVVGTGETLTQPHYLSTNAGVSDYRHIVMSRNVVYFYDTLNKKICRIMEEGVEFLSDTKQIRSLTKEPWSNVYVSYNPKYNEIVFSHDGESLIFNEYLDTFSGVYTHRHSDSTLGNHRYFTINREESSNSIYQDSVEGSDTMYDSTPEESMLTIIVNPMGNFISLYDILELTLEVYDSGGEFLPNNTITAIRCYNEWQDTGKIELDSEDNIIQRFRTWRMNALVDHTEDEARLRSSSLFIDIYFSNEENKKLVLHDLITKYRSNMPSQQESE